jgi:hypothetical protein
MKVRPVIRITVVILVVCAAHWLSYPYRIGSGRQRINAVSNLKQVGLSFRQGRNEWSETFPNWRDQVQRAEPEK